MCLRTVDAEIIIPEENKLPDGSVVGYKVVRRSIARPGAYFSPIYGGGYYRMGEPVKSFRGELIETERKPRQHYKAGFHVWLSKEDAIKYHATSPNSVYRIVKVLMREITCTGTNEISMNTYGACAVCQEMKLVEEITDADKT